MEPLGLKNINMFPTAEMKKNLAYMHQRWPGSQQSEERDHMYREPILAETDHEKKHVFHSGGAGAFAKPTEYVQVLATLLNDGKSPKTGAQILKKETVEAMFENQVRLPIHISITAPEFADVSRSPTSPTSLVKAYQPQKLSRPTQPPNSTLKRAILPKGVSLIAPANGMIPLTTVQGV